MNVHKNARLAPRGRLLMVRRIEEQALHGGRCRAGVLHRSIPGISKKMLTQTLREMEASGLVEQQVHGTLPPSVEYGLTSLGERFIEPTEWLYEWARQNNDALDELPPRNTSRRRVPVSGPRDGI